MKVPFSGGSLASARRCPGVIVIITAAAKIATIPITMRSSMRVKPFLYILYLTYFTIRLCLLNIKQIENNTSKCTGSYDML
jgi:hypothetical protein